MLKSKWARALPVLSFALVGVAGYFLYGILKTVKWQDVLNYLEDLSAPFLALLVGITTAIYLILSLYDYISFKTLLKTPPSLKIITPSAIVSYAFNFNLGAIVGGLGFRMRIYSGWGVSPKAIPLAALLSVVTTWVGYTFVLSLSLIFGEVPSKAMKFLPSFAPWALGALGLSLVTVYMVASFKEASFNIKSQQFIVPRPKLALLQIILSSLQWALASSVLYLLLNHFGAKLSWNHVFFTYLLASIGGVVARIPAGVGVIEAIFLKTLPGQSSVMLAALLCFRAIYFLMPLLLSLPGYLIIEFLQKSRKEKSEKKTETFLPSRKKDGYAR